MYVLFYSFTIVLVIVINVDLIILILIQLCFYVLVFCLGGFV